MSLMLSVLRCPDDAVPETRRLTGGELVVGRDKVRAQWVLADASQQVSRQHCTIRFDGAAWQLLDTSANGTFLNQDAAPLGQGGARALKNGDRIRIGPYEIEARIEAASVHAAPAPSIAEPWGGSMFPERPRSDDPFGAPSAFGASPSPFDLPARFDGTGARADEGRLTPTPYGDQSIALPPDLLTPDPFAPPPPAAPPATRPDHTPSFTDAIAPMRPLLSDDWAREFEFEDPFQTPAAAPPLASPPPVDPEADAAPEPLVPAPALMPVPAPAPMPVPAPAPMPVPAPRVAQGSESALLAAFMEGAGLPDLLPQDPVSAMRAAGAAFRAFVAGLREVLLVRAEMKGAMGIDKTYIRARGNNPLKFSAGDEDALTALLGTGRRTGMAPVDAVSEALRDIRMHEQATLPAMQAAIRALLGRLDPEKLRAEAEGGLALPGQRRARAFEQFEIEYARLTAALVDDFDAVFGRRFAEEYDRVVADLRAGEAPT